MHENMYALFYHTALEEKQAADPAIHLPATVGGLKGCRRPQESSDREVRNASLRCGEMRG